MNHVTGGIYYEQELNTTNYLEELLSCHFVLMERYE
jgi:hypothetical protein